VDDSIAEHRLRSELKAFAIHRSLSRTMVASIQPCGASVGTNSSFLFSSPNGLRSISRQCRFGMIRLIRMISGAEASAASPISKRVACTDGRRILQAFCPTRVSSPHCNPAARIDRPMSQPCSWPTDDHLFQAELLVRLLCNLQTLIRRPSERSDLELPELYRDDPGGFCKAAGEQPRAGNRCCSGRNL
jgi:hypothetical protein